ncbi:Sensor protein ZraS [Planctomycetes bacterium Poly30]|uniref:histidine kinase n=1 Tax=Saltatorellus ferox TaxID=2528018 RepID=A0A518EP67_9BACT|nr:Sensor protein ZraS [Planctomycetes bacterium Poly30]
MLSLLYNSTRLGRRLAGIYLVVAALFLGVASVVYVEIAGMRTDADRFLEEGRERVIVARIRSEVDSLSAILKGHIDGEMPAQVQVRYRFLCEEATRDLKTFLEQDDDPSRPDHQSDEEQVAKELLADLATLAAAVGPYARPTTDYDLLTLLDDVTERTTLLTEETLEEAAHAEENLEHRARTTMVVLAWTVSLALTLLLGSVYLVYRTVVQPLVELRISAEKFGEGQLDHRVQVKNHDEIGVLAGAMNSMASSLSNTQRQLETEIEDRTQEFVRAARMADLGVFAAGVAHEINTPLGSILSSAEGLERRVRKGDACEATQLDYLQVICGEATRARDIINRLLALSRQEASDAQWITVDHLFQQVQKSTAHALRSRKIELVTENDDPRLALEGNLGELVQIFVNLVLNARDATPDGGRIELTAEGAVGRVHFRVIDRGRGMEPEVSEQIFTPFYTTKAPGEGTGLGLALVSALTASRNGHIRVESALGKGTTFTLDFPKQFTPVT